MCRTSWAFTTVNPRPYFDRLAATIEELGRLRWILRQVVQLADAASTLTDRELRARLIALAEGAR